MRALVLWADNKSSNLGVRVLAQGMANLAVRAWGSDIVVEFLDFAGSESDVAVNKKSLIANSISRRGDLDRKFAGVDVVLDSGAGDSFSDIYGLRRFATITWAQALVSMAGTPLILGPQTIGPFQTLVGSRMGRRSLRRADLVISRDSQSAEQVGRVGSRRHIVATDVVFALPRDVVSQEHHDVVVNVSGLLWKKNPHVDAEHYRRQLITLCKELLNRGRKVSLLAHVLENPSEDNDVPAVSELATIVGPGVDVIVPASLSDARAHLAGAAIVIGSRMHACLNALSVGTPAVAWAYSRKFAPLMDDLGWSAHVDLRDGRDVVRETLEHLDVSRNGVLTAQARSLAREADLSLDRAADLMRSVVRPVHK